MVSRYIFLCCCCNRRSGSLRICLRANFHGAPRGSDGSYCVRSMRANERVLLELKTLGANESPVLCDLLTGRLFIYVFNILFSIWRSIQFQLVQCVCVCGNVSTARDVHEVTSHMSIWVVIWIHCVMHSPLFFFLFISCVNYQSIIFCLFGNWNEKYHEHYYYWYIIIIKILLLIYHQYEFIRVK